MDPGSGAGDPGQSEVRRPAGLEPPAQDLIDPANTGLGHRHVQRWNLPDGWVISARPAHPALVSEQDFIAVQAIHALTPAAEAASHEYLLAGLLRCGQCGRRLESCWANNRAAYRCRHGHSSASPPDASRPKNLYIREDQILGRLPALLILLDGEPVTAPAQAPGQLQTAEITSHLRARDITLTYDPRSRTLQADGTEVMPVTVIGTSR